MMRFTIHLIVTTATLAFALPLPALAAPSLTRTFVSSAGSDSNPCTITQPCATFAAAYAATAPNGIIAALDPGKYGPLTITSSITINGNGWAAITGPAGGNGITVSAGTSDSVTLRGLEIDGANAAYNGIVVYSTGNITIIDCFLQNFLYASALPSGEGIAFQPTSGTIEFTIKNTIAQKNGDFGFSYYVPSGTPSANGVIDHFVATGSTGGIGFNTTLATGGTTVVTISNSTVSYNLDQGISILNNTAPLTASIDHVTASGNGTGIQASNSAKVLLGRSAITGNSFGVDNETSPNTLYTSKDNRIGLNGTNLTGTALNTTLPQE